MLQEVSPEERHGLLPGCWRHANPDKGSADDAREVDGWEADAGKDESAREKWVRVNSSHSADLRDADLRHAKLLDYAAVNCADARLGVYGSQARYGCRNGRTDLLKETSDEPNEAALELFGRGAWEESSPRTRSQGQAVARVEGRGGPEAPSPTRHRGSRAGGDQGRAGGKGSAQSLRDPPSSLRAQTVAR